MKQRILMALLAWAMVPALASATGRESAAAATAIDAAAAGRFARLALECVHREYPNKIAQVMQSDADAKPPRALTPAFYGCYDWHSSVHGHWLLVRLVKLFPDADFAAPARAAHRMPMPNSRSATPPKERSRWLRRKTKSSPRWAAMGCSRRRG